MSITHVSTKTEPLTRKLAHDFATMRGFVGERPLRDSRVTRLRNLHEAGLFHPCRWAKFLYKNKVSRADGNSSSNMLNALPEEKFPRGMKVIIDTYQIDTPQDAAILFAQFDSRESSRTPTEVVNAHVRLHKQLEDLTDVDAARAMRGIAYALGGGSLATCVPAERGRMVHDHVCFLSWMRQFNRTSYLKRHPVAAAMFDTYSVDEKDATKFWQWVRDQNHPERDHPTRLLADFLQSSITYSTTETRRRAWPQRAFYVKCLHAWNAYRRKQPTNLHYRKNAGIPKAI